MVDTGILSNKTRSSSLTNAKWHSVAWPNTWQPSTDQTLYQSVTFYLTRPFIDLWEASIEHLRRVKHADRGRLLLRTHGPVPFGTRICSTCCDQYFFPELVVIFGTMLFEYPSVLSRFCLPHKDSVGQSLIWLMNFRHIEFRLVRWYLKHYFRND